jgi:hypothetical protein
LEIARSVRIGYGVVMKGVVAKKNKGLDDSNPLSAKHVSVSISDVQAKI